MVDIQSATAENRRGKKETTGNLECEPMPSVIAAQPNIGGALCGLSEVRWDGQGHFTTLDGHTIVYSGRPTQGMSEVAVWIHSKIAGDLVGYEPISNGVLAVRLQCETMKHYSDSSVWTNDSSHGGRNGEVPPRLISSS